MIISMQMTQLFLAAQLHLLRLLSIYRLPLIFSSPVYIILNLFETNKYQVHGFLSYKGATTEQSKY